MPPKRKGEECSKHEAITDMKNIKKIKQEAPQQQSIIQLQHEKSKEFEAPVSTPPSKGFKPRIKSNYPVVSPVFNSAAIAASRQILTEKSRLVEKPTLAKKSALIEKPTLAKKLTLSGKPLLAEKVTLTEKTKQMDNSTLAQSSSVSSDKDRGMVKQNNDPSADSYMPEFAEDVEPDVYEYLVNTYGSNHSQHAEDLDQDNVHHEIIDANQLDSDDEPQGSDTLSTYNPDSDFIPVVESTAAQVVDVITNQQQQPQTANLHENNGENNNDNENFDQDNNDQEEEEVIAQNMNNNLMRVQEAEDELHECNKCCRICRRERHLVIEKLNTIIAHLQGNNNQPAMMTQNFDLLPKFPFEEVNAFIQFGDLLQENQQVKAQFHSKIITYGGDNLKDNVYYYNG